MSSTRRPRRRQVGGKGLLAFAPFWDEGQRGAREREEDEFYQEAKAAAGGRHGSLGCVGVG